MPLALARHPWCCSDEQLRKNLGCYFDGGNELRNTEGYNTSRILLRARDARHSAILFLCSALNPCFSTLYAETSYETLRATTQEKYCCGRVTRATPQYSSCAPPSTRVSPLSFFNPPLLPLDPHLASLHY